MDQINFVGCMLSLDCGESLGTIHGVVTDVNKDKQTISLKKTFRNGAQCDVQEITILASDIRDLTILKSLDEENDPTGITSKPNTDSTQRNGTNGISYNSIPNNTKQNKPQTNGGGQRTPKKQERQQGNSNSRTPTKREDIPNHSSSGNKSAIYSGSHHSAFQRVQKDEVRDQGSEEEREVNEDKGRRQRYHSGNFEPNQKVRSSPRKVEGSQKQRRGAGVNARNAECFSAPVESYLSPDFDFDKSMKSFNKAAIFEEFASTMSSGDGKRKSKNIPHDEDIILDNIPTFVHDKGHGQVKCSSYTSESGVVVPAVTVDVVQRLFQAAEKLGLTTERRLEAGGVCIARMALHLIGGKTSPPSILVVCGPHLQGAQGINCARHLANHNANVSLFIPNFAKMPDVLMTELRLFKETGGFHVTSIKDLPEAPHDVIINALDSSNDTLLSKQPWHRSIVSWVDNNKASVLSIDPTLDHSVRSKWSVITALPLSYNNTNTGMLYLCDVGIPSKVFSMVGVDYVTPFRNKFVVLLHNR
ncbi:enhancer of mRNA-decapping protein 3-like [Asterias rubens]|uniref:enhancer of mRNA-decapping protein 3-like n=1 Tax=Asterias rubens TaxID=7604 RepID=UPI0014559161|nr:enhancer of mRNA-decapping protein 3-like [Asterias rubens]